MEPDHGPLSLLNFSNAQIPLQKHSPVGSLQMYTGYQHEQNISAMEANQILVENENDILPCTPRNYKFVHSLLR